MLPSWLGSIAASSGVGLPARRQQPPVGARVALHVLVEPGGRVPGDQVGAAQRSAEGGVRDEAELVVRAAADDQLAGVDARLAVGERRLALGERIGVGRVGLRREAVVGRHAERRLGDRRRRHGSPGRTGTASPAGRPVVAGRPRLSQATIALTRGSFWPDERDTRRAERVAGEPDLASGSSSCQSGLYGGVQARRDAPVLLGRMARAAVAARPRLVDAASAWRGRS